MSISLQGQDAAKTVQLLASMSKNIDGLLASLGGAYGYQQGSLPDQYLPTVQLKGSCPAGTVGVDAETEALVGDDAALHVKQRDSKGRLCFPKKVLAAAKRKAKREGKQVSVPRTAVGQVAEIAYRAAEVAAILKQLNRKRSCSDAVNEGHCGMLLTADGRDRCAWKGGRCLQVGGLPTDLSSFPGLKTVPSAPPMTQQDPAEAHRRAFAAALQSRRAQLDSVPS